MALGLLWLWRHDAAVRAEALAATRLRELRVASAALDRTMGERDALRAERARRDSVRNLEVARWSSLLGEARSAAEVLGERAATLSDSAAEAPPGPSRDSLLSALVLLHESRAAVLSGALDAAEQRDDLRLLQLADRDSTIAEQALSLAALREQRDRALSLIGRRHSPWRPGFFLGLGVGVDGRLRAVLGFGVPLPF